MKWTFATFSKLLDDKYKADNPFKRYDIFLTGFFASLGFAQERNPATLKLNIKRLESSLKSDDTDPIRLREFQTCADSFKSGIGEKRRKLVFEAFKTFLLSNPNLDEKLNGATHMTDAKKINFLKIFKDTFIVSAQKACYTIKDDSASDSVTLSKEGIDYKIILPIEEINAELDEVSFISETAVGGSEFASVFIRNSQNFPDDFFEGLEIKGCVNARINKETISLPLICKNIAKLIMFDESKMSLEVELTKMLKEDFLALDILEYINSKGHYKSGRF